MTADRDPREAAWQYQIDKMRAEAGEDVAPAEESPPAYTAAQRQAVVEQAIQQAIRRGDFDDLPGAGKPLEHMGSSHDPDWWIRRKIETEQLTGLAPPALALRAESAELREQLDEMIRESDVREAVADFNFRVIEARRQLLGGPPVVTPTRDVDAEVAAWRERREERSRRAAQAARAAAENARRESWWRRLVRQRDTAG